MKSKTSVARANRTTKPDQLHAAMDDMAKVSLGVYGLAQKLELLQFAQIGLVRSFADLKVDPANTVEYFELLSNGLDDAQADASALSRRLVDVGQRLHRLCGKRS